MGTCMGVFQLSFVSTLSLFSESSVLGLPKFPSDQMPARMTAPHPLLPHLKAISLESPSCTLLTKDKGRMEVLCSFSAPSLSIFSAFFFQVQSHLLSILSPFLATLLAQAGPRPTISLPCSETALRSECSLVTSPKGLFSKYVHNLKTSIYSGVYF